MNRPAPRHRPAANPGADVPVRSHPRTSRDALNHEAGHLSRRYGLSQQQAHRMMELAFDHLPDTAHNGVHPAEQRDV